MLAKRRPLTVAEQAELEHLERLEADEIERAACEASLMAFFKRAWREIDPAPFEENWHHHVICAQLEALARGEFRDCIINIPPRTGKSILINVCLPAWLWLQAPDPNYPMVGPHCSFLCVSYGADLAEIAAAKMRQLVQGEWYQRLWGERVQITRDQIADLGNAAGGERISNSIQGGILGRGALVQIVDDPHKLDAVESDLERQRTIRALSEGLTTRVTDPRISARIMVMQRLHSDDATDHALKNWRPDLVHIMLPMRFDPDRACFCDVRERRGELLWPDFWTEDNVLREERELGPYASAGQLQQSPVPRGGGIIKREWLQGWPPLNPDGSFPHDMVSQPQVARLADGSVRREAGRIQYPALEYVVGCVDTAFTSKQEADRSAMAVLGVFRAEGKGRIERQPDGTFRRVADDYGFPKVLLLHGWAKRLDLHGPLLELPPGIGKEQMRALQLAQRDKWGLVEWVVDTGRRYKIDHLVILTLGQGHGLEQELRRLHSDADWGVEMQLERGDKEARAYAQQHLFSAGQIYVPMYEDGTTPSWCEPLIDELCTFPRHRYKDFVDAMMGALRHLRDTGLMERRDEFERAEERAALWPVNRPRSLPYDV